jgi:2'-5' RNA ligase
MPKKSVTTLRAFVALDLDSMSARRIARVSDRMRMGSGAPSATWTPNTKLHVTLKFMGELPEDAVAPLGKALGPLAEGKPAPSPSTFRLDAFPRVADARVLVVELSDARGDLGKLADRVDKLAAKYGVAKEKRAFRPHVTLARLKLSYDARKWLKPELAEVAGELKATHLTLYRSILGQGEEGAEYVPLARWTFAAVE